MALKNRSMKINTVIMKAVVLLASATAAVGALSACSPAEAGGETAASAEQPAETEKSSPSDVLASTPWETTGATDADGNDVDLEDENVANFVGWAYFKDDGSFTMYNLDDTPKMHGDWTVSEDGKTRTIVAKDDEGNEEFTRDSVIVTLTEDEFTYRVYPDENDKSVYFDIIHTPTDHKEPNN
ncbi:protein of unknown function [Brevibacterium siliguriense]|uniref:DUF4822 domain-containing protein n=1 Tax=Brevibacterium siliguriense TaxID=1136497 RepID=A0A1H1V6V7_9MICO|nr:DUF4822 domain-containing protein [Brevibacterium siliguriense]SDS80452.1 protein of unknown function [Brevibacterium siliguriense]